VNSPSPTTLPSSARVDLHIARLEYEQCADTGSVDSVRSNDRHADPPTLHAQPTHPYPTPHRLPTQTHSQEYSDLKRRTLVVNDPKSRDRPNY